MIHLFIIYVLLTKKGTFGLQFMLMRNVKEKFMNQFFYVLNISLSKFLIFYLLVTFSCDWDTSSKQFNITSQKKNFM